MIIDDMKRDQLQSRRKKNASKTAILTYIMGLVSQHQVVDDMLVISLIKQNVKSMKAAIDATPSTKDVLQPDIDVLESYLPVVDTITAHDVIRVVRPMVTIGEKNIGKLIGAVKMDCGVTGKAFDGNIARTAIEQLIKG